jgi:hypothetical protein
LINAFASIWKFRKSSACGTCPVAIYFVGLYNTLLPIASLKFIAKLSLGKKASCPPQANKIGIFILFNEGVKFIFVKY